MIKISLLRDSDNDSDSADKSCFLLELTTFKKIILSAPKGKSESFSAYPEQRMQELGLQISWTVEIPSQNENGCELALNESLAAKKIAGVFINTSFSTDPKTIPLVLDASGLNDYLDNLPDNFKTTDSKKLFSENENDPRKIKDTLEQVRREIFSENQAAPVNASVPEDKENEAQGDSVDGKVSTTIGPAISPVGSSSPNKILAPIPIKLPVLLPQLLSSSKVFPQQNQNQNQSQNQSQSQNPNQNPKKRKKYFFDSTVEPVLSREKRKKVTEIQIKPPVQLK